MALSKETWNSRIGVILAVAGSAVGLGNFLRFPGKAAIYGGGAFMLAYFIAFLLIGLPLCWAEWTLGRHAGQRGYNSCPGILYYITRKRSFKYIGILGVLIPVVIYMYYVCIEAWCLGYAVNFLKGDLQFQSIEESGSFLGAFIGAGENGSALGFGWKFVGGYLAFCFLLNFVLIYRGIAKGIEFFCRYAMPALIILGFILLGRVLTLDTSHLNDPEKNVDTGLGFMWNPNKYYVSQKVSEEPLRTVNGSELVRKMETQYADKVGFRVDRKTVPLSAIVEKQTPDGWQAMETLNSAEVIAKRQEQLAETEHYRVTITESQQVGTLIKSYPEGKWIKVNEVVGEENVAAARAAIADNPNQRIREVSLFQQLLNPSLWMDAAAQIFFSLSVGLGVIITYSSYMRRNDDVILSGLTAASANEFCEIALGGLITIPASVAFLGVTGIASMVGSTFGLGFNILPLVFAQMPLGEYFGFFFFFLLFLAAVTSSLSMLQPGIAYLEEVMEINRKESVAILGLLTAFGAMFVIYFSQNVKALDTMDFWAGTFLIYVLAMIQITIFGWVFGVERGFREAQQGSIIRIPNIYKFIIKYISPTFLGVVFVLWIITNVFGFSHDAEIAQVSSYITDLIGDADRGITPDPVALITFGFIVMIYLFFALIMSGSKRLRKLPPASGNEDAL